MEEQSAVLNQPKTSKGKAFADKKAPNKKPAEQLAPEIKKKKLPLRFIILGIVLTAGGIIGYNKISFALTHETTDNAQVETQIIPVLPRVSGYVKSIAVSDYGFVSEGEL